MTATRLWPENSAAASLIAAHRISPSRRVDPYITWSRGITPLDLFAAAKAPPAATKATAIRSAPGGTRSPGAPRPAAGRASVSSPGAERPRERPLRDVRPPAGRARRHRHDGNSMGERFLGDPHAGVADDAHGPLEQRRMRSEALDVDVLRRIEAGGSTSAVVTATSNGSPAKAAHTVSRRRRSFWNSVEQVMSTSGCWTSSSQAGGSAGGSHRPGPTSFTSPANPGARVLERLRRVREYHGGHQINVLDRPHRWGDRVRSQRVHGRR